MDYPSEATFEHGYGRGVIRLKVAAICACIDTAQSGEGSGLEEEIEPFIRTVDITLPNGGKDLRKIDPHAFLYIAPAGNLQMDVEEVLAALCASIDKGQLPTVFLKISLAGEIELNETWISTKDFMKWCASRGLSYGEMCDEYDRGEESIMCHAIDNADDKRAEFEAPYFCADYAKLGESDSETYSELAARYQKLYLENFLLKSGYYTELSTDEEVVDLPLNAKERNTLLAIIAALCNQNGIKPQARGVAPEIVRMAGLIGVPLDPGTVLSALKQIPDAVGRRQR
jgi:hypothetical protein